MRSISKKQNNGGVGRGGVCGKRDHIIGLLILFHTPLTHSKKIIKKSFTNLKKSTFT